MRKHQLREWWFALLLRAFPRAYRMTNGSEMIGAIQSRASWSVLVLIRESIALIKAGVTVSFRESISLPSSDQIAWGATAWLGLLLGIGPLMRVAERVYSYGPQVSGKDAGLAIIGIVVAIAVLPRSRLVGFMVVGIALLAAARSTALGSWTVSEAYVYEALWLLPALLVAGLVGSRRLAMNRWLILIPTIPSGWLMAALVGADRSLGRTYGYAVQSMVFDARLATVGASIVFLMVLFAPGLLTRFILPLTHVLVLAASGRQFGVIVLTGTCLVVLALNAQRQDRQPQQTPVSG